MNISRNMKESSDYNLCSLLVNTFPETFSIKTFTFIEWLILKPLKKLFFYYKFKNNQSRFQSFPYFRGPVGN